MESQRDWGFFHHGGTEDTEEYTEEQPREAFLSMSMPFSVYSSVLSVPPW
jgi:hypothetical protein